MSSPATMPPVRGRESFHDTRVRMHAEREQARRDARLTRQHLNRTRTAARRLLQLWRARYRAEAMAHATTLGKLRAAEHAAGTARLERDLHGLTVDLILEHADGTGSAEDRLNRIRAEVHKHTAVARALQDEDGDRG